ncbi:hypothetical protein [Bacillus norwichensis]|uniref:Uncharacterized protein n=1 Tax=Bacillus norwichensis TaxID=2762217 RepID=A0ABR8VM54_9BACI|nr:hypothetical protein [Bacillus norwichensis]MBD8005843.1 hypothetical protein [Bacillus norwichensis]
MKSFVETYKCHDCVLEFGVDRAMYRPLCPSCGEHLDITETTDTEVNDET